MLSAGSDGDAHLRRPRSRVGGLLDEGRANRIVADLLVDTGAKAIAESRFYQAVFTAVKANNRGPATGPQARRQHAQQFLQVGEFAVDQDSQGLEDAGRRADLLLTRRGFSRQRVRVQGHGGRFQNQFHQLARSFQRRYFATFNDGSGNALGIRFVAEVAEAGR